MDCIIETDRLCLRLWKEEDKKEFNAMNSDPAVMEYFPKTLNIDESGRLMEKIIKSIDEKTYGLWAVETKIDNRFIGFIGISNVTFESYFTPCIEIGWRLKKEAWGKGYATEGAKACLKYAFQILKLMEIYSFTALINERSERLMQKIGMTKIGEFDHPNVEKGSQLKRHVLYKLTREKYLEQNK